MVKDISTPKHSSCLNEDFIPFLIHFSPRQAGRESSKISDLKDSTLLPEGQKAQSSRQAIDTENIFKMQSTGGV